MSAPPRPLACDVCGAVLPAPDDDAVLSVTCAHCRHVQALPDAERRRARQQERQARVEHERQRKQIAEAQERMVRSSSRMSLWITLGTLAFGLAITAVTAGPSILGTWTAVAPGLGVAPLAPTPIPVVPSAPSAPPVVIAVAPPPPARDPAALAEAARTRLGGRMRERVAAGCGRVILPPEVATGARSMTATLVVGRQCIDILAVAGAPEAALTVTMSTPFGEPVPAPAAAAEPELRYCPTVAGPHPVRVAPSTNDPYAIAALECPSRIVARPRGR